MGMLGGQLNAVGLWFEVEVCTSAKSVHMEKVLIVDVPAKKNGGHV